MSPKSRPPKAKKGKKGKKGAEGVEESLTVTQSGGVPFGLVVLIAVVISIPSIVQFSDGTMAFDSTVLRFLAALAVSWLLVGLVVTVIDSFGRAPKAPSPLDHGVPGGPGGFVPDPDSPYRVAPPVE